MVQFLSTIFFFLDFFNFCWVFQKFPFLGHPVLIVGEDIFQLLRIYPATITLSVFYILPAVIWGRTKEPTDGQSPTQRYHNSTKQHKNNITY